MQAAQRDCDPERGVEDAVAQAERVDARQVAGIGGRCVGETDDVDRIADVEVADRGTAVAGKIQLIDAARREHDRVVSR